MIENKKEINKKSALEPNLSEKKSIVNQIEYKKLFPFSNKVDLYPPSKGEFTSHLNFDNTIDKDNLQAVKEYNERVLLGKGTYSEVILSKDISTNKIYACKIINKIHLKKVAKDNDKMIKNEVGIHGRITHPNIIKMYNFYETQNNYYILLEYASKGILFTEIRKERGFNENKSFFYFIQTLNAVYFLHKNNIIHRDIKPENLMLTDNNEIKLGDFGWAVIVMSEKTRTTFCGTVEYMAPEIINNKNYDSSIDVWSLGILLYELLHGHSPFVSDDLNVYKTEENIVVNDDIKFKKNLSKDCIDLIKKLLKKDSKERIKIGDIYQHPFIKRYINMLFILPTSKEDNKEKKIKKVEIIDVNKDYLTNKSYVNNYTNFNIDYGFTEKSKKKLHTNKKIKINIDTKKNQTLNKIDDIITLRKKKRCKLNELCKSVIFDQPDILTKREVNRTYISKLLNKQNNSYNFTPSFIKINRKITKKILPKKVFIDLESKIHKKSTSFEESSGIVDCFSEDNLTKFFHKNVGEEPKVQRPHISSYFENNNKNNSSIYNKSYVINSMSEAINLKENKKNKIKNKFKIPQIKQKTRNKLMKCSFTKMSECMINNTIYNNYKESLINTVSTVAVVKKDQSLTNYVKLGNKTKMLKTELAKRILIKNNLGINRSFEVPLGLKRNQTELLKTQNEAKVKTIVNMKKGNVKRQYPGKLSDKLNGYINVQNNDKKIYSHLYTKTNNNLNYLYVPKKKISSQIYSPIIEFQKNKTHSPITYKKNYNNVNLLKTSENSQANTCREKIKIESNLNSFNVSNQGNNNIFVSSSQIKEDFRQTGSSTKDYSDFTKAVKA